MSIPWEDFVAQLGTRLDDLSSIPDPIVDNKGDFESALLDLPLYPSLYGASFLAPEPTWAPRALDWSKQGKEDGAISAWISRGLASGTWDTAPWFDELGKPENARLRDVFAHWGKFDLESCLSACDKHFSPAKRIHILTLLLEIILSISYAPGTPSNTTAMYTLACHPFLDLIIQSLLLDTGNNLFPLGLRTILAVIPYAPQVVTAKVPLLMVILGRAVCWRDRPFLDAGTTSDAPATHTPLPRQEWAIATSAMEEQIDQPISLQPVNIVRLWLVAIYGAWPSNLLAFVRDPVTYLRGKQIECPYQVDWEEVWPTGLLAARTGPLMREFALHPSIMYFNSDGELRDAKRWEKTDPPEHVSAAHIIAHSERLSQGKTDFFDETVTSESQSEQVPESSSSARPHETDSIESLRRENMLLRLEAGYADRLRKQYLFHIGRLHKHSMRFSVDEAEVHSFANRMKEQKSEIETLKNDVSRTRRDASQAQQKHSKWQESLRDKLSNNREERRNWQNEAASLRTDRSELETAVMRQKAELAQVKNERFKLQNQLNEVMPKVRHIEDYEIRMEQYFKAQQLWDRDIKACKDAESDAEKWKGRVWQLEQLLASIQRPMARRHTLDDQRPTAELQENSSKIAQAPKALKADHPDWDHMVAAVDGAQKRAEDLERENLELHVKLEELLRTKEAVSERNSLWSET